jgi:hypothetical protein
MRDTIKRTKDWKKIFSKEILDKTSPKIYKELLKPNNLKMNYLES